MCNVDSPLINRRCLQSTRMFYKFVYFPEFQKNYQHSVSANNLIITLFLSNVIMSLAIFVYIYKRIDIMKSTGIYLTKIYWYSNFKNVYFCVNTCKQVFMSIWKRPNLYFTFPTNERGPNMCGVGAVLIYKYIVIYFVLGLFPFLSGDNRTYICCMRRPFWVDNWITR